MLDLNFQNGTTPALNARNMNAIVESINTLDSTVTENYTETSQRINTITGSVDDLRTQLASPFTYKGTVATVSSLPSSGNTMNDTYFVEDQNCLYSWNGTAWSQSSYDADGYAQDLAELKSDLGDISEVGKNLFNRNNVNSLDAYINDGVLSANANAKTVYITCEPSTTYTISKTSATKRFSVAYTDTVPVAGGSVSGVKTYNNNTSISITTGASATYLVAFIYLSTADTLTFAQICDMLQIEVGSEATAYEPYKLGAVDPVARNGIEELHTYPIIESDSTSAILGDEMVSDFAGLTPTGSSSYAGGVWTIPSGSGLSASLNVTAWKMYLVSIGCVNSTASDDSGMYKVNPLRVTLGSDSVDIFANFDGNWKIGLVPNTTGVVAFSIQCMEALNLVIDGLSIKQVLRHADMTALVNNYPIIFSEYNAVEKSMAIGNGLTRNVTGNSNTAMGHNAQAGISTGYGNTALGAYAQHKAKTGLKNVAVGDNTQVELIGGAFNNAMGTAAQKQITIGSWNNAIGNEAQRDITTGCNNVGVGRRAQSFLTTGGMNTAVGAMAGFAKEGHQGGDLATTISNFQTLIGGETTQATSAQTDYLTAIGFRATGNEKGTAIGANSSALGEQSVAIGYGATATDDNDVAIGNNDSSIILAGKRIVFNSDGTVTWAVL